MRGYRTDLAVELRDSAMREYAKTNEGEIDGVIYKEEKINENITKSTIEIINEAGERAIGKERGKYITFIFPEPDEMDRVCFDALYKALSDTFRELCLNEENAARSMLFCGLGNRKLTADSIGPAAADGILATHHIKASDAELFSQIGFFDTAVISPGVSSQTGMETFDTVKSAVFSVKPDVVIAADALCARGTERLCKTIQLSTTGISPGAGIGNFHGKLDEKGIGVPVIGVGVPTVIDAATLVCDFAGDEKLHEKISQKAGGLFVSPKNADTGIKILSRILSYAVNTAFQSGLTAEETELMQ